MSLQVLPCMTCCLPMAPQAATTALVHNKPWRGCSVELARKWVDSCVGSTGYLLLSCTGVEDLTIALSLGPVSSGG